MAYRKRRSGNSRRKLTPEQIAKMKEGREKAAARRQEAEKTRERVALLSDLDERLSAAKHESYVSGYPRRKVHRKRYK